MESVRTIDSCRACGSTNLIECLDLGSQPFSGFFPIQKEEAIFIGSLVLVFCKDCDLVQLAHDFPAELMYGDNYGYKSSLNSSMSEHLVKKAKKLSFVHQLKPGDTVVDIGSNDGTFLNAFDSRLERIGIDPTISKFASTYDSGIQKVSKLFSNDLDLGGVSNVKLITCISMFYDVSKPIEFAQKVKQLLNPEGIWHFEQSYLNSMIRMNSFDTVCHEHTSYYSIASISRILDAAGLRIIDIEFNDINGGSFAVTATHRSTKIASASHVEWFLNQEKKVSVNLRMDAFRKQVELYKNQLNEFLLELDRNKKEIWGLGASTKGNVILNYCGINSSTVKKIVEVNPNKFGRVTPGSGIEIVPESELLSGPPDYLLVLPWHFRRNILDRHKKYCSDGGKLIFPLPNIEVA